MSGQQKKEQNPANYVCPLCKYADRGATAWPCKTCPRINQMEDHFEPNDEGVEIPPLPRDEWAASMAEHLFKKFSVNCGNCPATTVCIARYKEQPKSGDANCLDAFAFWMRQETNNRR